MKINIRLLGTEVLHVEIGGADESDDQRGDCTTYPIGFTPSPGDQRWERGVDLD